MQFVVCKTFGWATSENKAMTTDMDVGTGGAGGTYPHFSQIIRQSAPLQLKKLPVFVMRVPLNIHVPPHFLNASYIPDC